jgi:uncharacterized protein DUF6282
MAGEGTPVLPELLAGAIDLHYHSAPSPFPRALTPGEAARHYAEAGFRAVVLKSHHHITVMDVLSIQDLLLDELELEVYGGIALNGTVGGLNPAAVELCLQMGGRIVWFPTLSSHAHIDFHRHHVSNFPTAVLRPEPPITVLDDGGKLKPEVHEILELVRDSGAILASGHLSAPELLPLFEAAHAIGIEKLLVQHPNFVLGLTHDDARRLTALGAYIEHSVIMFHPNGPAKLPIGDFLEWIGAVGADRTVFGSDTGQATSPSPADIYTVVAGLLLDNGVSEDDVRKMAVDNAATLLA